jgi:osmotically-inducible protein OsmY
MLQDKNVPSSAIKVVSERAVVYLMGRVTPAEGEAAARVASRVSGVQRVVKNFDYLTEAEAAAEAAKAAPAKQ